MTANPCVCDPDDCDVTGDADECFDADCQHCLDQRPDIEVVTIWKQGDPCAPGDIYNAYLAARQTTDRLTPKEQP